MKNQFFLLAPTLLLAASANAGIQDQNRDHNTRPPPLYDGFSNPFFTDKFSAWEAVNNSVTVQNLTAYSLKSI